MIEFTDRPTDRPDEGVFFGIFSHNSEVANRAYRIVMAWAGMINNKKVTVLALVTLQKCTTFFKLADCK